MPIVWRSIQSRARSWAADVQAASASQMGRFATETQSLSENRKVPVDPNGQLIKRIQKRNRLKFIVLGMGRFREPAQGDQEGAT